MELKVWILKQGYSLNWIEYTRKWVGGAVEREKKSKREKRERERERDGFLIEEGNVSILVLMLIIKKRSEMQRLA